MTSILTFDHVDKSYGQKSVLNDLNFELPGGSIIGLLGPNGSGKTTMLKLMNGLLTPTAGRVLINGMAPGIETKRIISYLPERTYLSKWMKVRDIIAFFQDFYSDFDPVKANAMLADLDIPDSQPLRTMSKGTKEKVQLILVMSRQAKLYLLDEPIGGVDPAARDYILRTILGNYAEDASIIISTHLIQDVETIFDRVLFLSQGQILVNDTVDNIREQEGKSIDSLFREVFKC